MKLISREIYPLGEPGSSLKLFGSERVNLWDLRGRIGFVSQDLQENYTPYTTALEVILSGFFGAIGSHEHLLADAEQVSRAKALLVEIGLEGSDQRMFQRLSTGQKRRLLLARALVHEPRALILDEPASGLDMGAALGLLTLLRRFCREDRSLIITTHHVDEIVPEIQRVVLIDRGCLVADDAKSDMD